MEIPNPPALHRTWPAEFRRLARSSEPAVALLRSCCLAKDYTVLPVQILDSHPEEFSFVPHSPVAHQDDDVTKKVTSSWASVASQASHRQFPFRFIVKTKMSTVLFHHFDFRSVADHVPLLCFVQHSSQRPQSAIGIRGRAWKFQLLSEISRDLVDSQTRNGCRFE
jgi:hypothetical protein